MVSSSFVLEKKKQLMSSLIFFYHPNKPNPPVRILLYFFEYEKVRTVDREMILFFISPEIPIGK